MSMPAYSEAELRQFQTLISILGRLRAPGGCPWDREQTHASLKRNLLEESYEVLEAIDREDPQGLAEELGDLLVQVGFHGQIAQESGEFDLGDVLTLVNQKLVRRHPHVFGDATAADAREVEQNWEKIKEAEREQQGERKSPVEGIPKDLPSLAVAQLMQDRVGRAGFEWEDISGVLDKVAEEVDELRQAGSHQEKVHELGDLFFVMVNLARWLGTHAEDALRQANAKFEARFSHMENAFTEAGRSMDETNLDEMMRHWDEAKALGKTKKQVTGPGG